MDPSSGVIEYFTNELGNCVAFAGMASRGWIGMGPEMYSRVMGNTDRIDAFSIESLGSKIFHGKEIKTYQMTLQALKGRETQTVESDILESLSYGSTTQFEFPTRTERWLINYQDIEFKEKIGSGSFGEVKLGILKGKRVAVKQLIKQRLADVALLELQAEAAILRYEAKFHSNQSINLLQFSKSYQCLDFHRSLHEITQLVSCY